MLTGVRGMSVPGRRAEPAIVTLPDRIDKENAESVYARLRLACGPGVTVVADLTGTQFCDSTGIRNHSPARVVARAGDRTPARPGPRHGPDPARSGDRLGLAARSGRDRLRWQAFLMLISAARIVPATGGVLAPGYLAFDDGVITGIGAGTAARQA